MSDYQILPRLPKKNTGEKRRGEAAERQHGAREKHCSKHISLHVVHGPAAAHISVRGSAESPSGRSRLVRWFVGWTI